MGGGLFAAFYHAGIYLLGARNPNSLGGGGPKPTVSDWLRGRFCFWLRCLGGEISRRLVFQDRGLS